MENAYKCLHTGGSPPFGFDVGDDKKLKINESEAKGVKLAFDMYIDGSGYRQIAEELNYKGYKSKRNGEFKYTSIREMLRNDKYIGYYTYNKRNTKNHNSHQFNDESEIIRIKDGVPRIISDDVWFKVQKRLKQNKRIPQNKKKIYLLSGLVKCSECGKYLVGHTTYNSKGYANSSYRCPSRCAPERCQVSQVGKHQIESTVLAEVRRLIFSNDSAKKIESKLKQEIAQSKLSIQGDLKSIRLQISKADKEISNIINAIKAGVDTASMRTEIKKLENNKSYLESRMLQVNEIHKATVPSLYSIKEFIKKSRGLLDGSDIQLQRLIKAFVQEVTFYPDGTIKINLVVVLNGSGERIRTSDPPGMNRML